MDIKSLGFSNEEIRERIVDRFCELIMTDHYFETGIGESQLVKDIKKLVTVRTDEKVAEMAQKHILPNISDYIEDLTLTETNRWGETKGETVTFVEYLTDKAEKYLTEKVDYEGKSRGEARGCRTPWEGTQTRIAHMIHKHLHYSIESAVKQAVKNANLSIAQGIEGVVKIKLKEISEKLKVSIKSR